MTIPIAVLLGFAAWTLATLLATIGWYRWSRIFAGRAAINEFEADAGRAAGWYQRAHRAHANCLENLPLYAALVVVIVATGASHPALDGLALVLLGARVAQTVTHVAFSSSERAVAVRFVFFFTQVVCITAMGVLIARA
jgi:uncharacterized MAPEG superfamily protein